MDPKRWDPSYKVSKMRPPPFRGECNNAFRGGNAMSVIMAVAFDGENPAWPNTYCTTIVHRVLVSRALQDFYH